MVTTQDDNFGLSIAKPVSAWNKPIKIEPKSFFLKLGKAAVKGYKGDFEDAGENLTEALFEAKLNDKAGQVAWVLIYRALTKAVADLVLDSEDLFDLVESPADDTKQEELVSILNGYLEQCQVSIEPGFFQRPQDLPLLAEFKQGLLHWLTGLGLPQSQAQALVNRLPDRFTLALHEEWLKEPERYTCIKTAIDTPFTQAVKKTRQWLHYHAWLREQVNQRMFAEAFSLQSVYIPLRAYYEEKKDKGIESLERDEEKIKQVVDLQTELEAWAKHFDSQDAVRVISGGPGSGKSSFTKMFAAHIADTAGIPVLFIPLHLFDPSADLIQAVANFVSQSRYLEGSPLDAKDGENRLLIIFDGLDELSMQGKAAAEAAQSLVDEVIRKIDSFNYQGLQRQVLLSGRDLVVQSNAGKFRSPKQILSILPYYLNEDEIELYHDPQTLLKQDQRQAWWINYGKASGKGYQGMPKSLQGNNLDEITRWPLLNYLVSLSYERKTLDFDKQTTLNQVYSDLLEAVYERQYEGGRKHKGTGNLQYKDFCRVLEEIALSIWHGDGRTTTVDYIQKRCDISSLGRYLSQFEEGAQKGVTRLLTAFYFRQSGEIKGEKTFEFTHKSFGEYLTACRYVRLMGQVQKQLDRHTEDPDDGWDTREALKQWAEICGPTTIENYLNNFIKNEVALQSKETIEKWQYTLCRLIEYTATHGLPMEKLGLSSFQQMMKQSQNAGVALLALHAACAFQTEQCLPMQWPSKTTFGDWLCHIRRQRLEPEQILESFFLYLDFSGCYLAVQDFFSSDFSGANLQNAFLSQANFVRSQFVNANFEGANLVAAKLDNVNLLRANLKGVDLIGAELQGASLYKANLQNAKLSGTLLDGLNIQEIVERKEPITAEWVAGMKAPQPSE